jgi:hypothetical protein
VVIPGVSLSAGENAPGVPRQALRERLALGVFNEQVRALARDRVPAREGRVR